MSKKPYLPAAGHDAALPLYDPVVRLMGMDKAWTSLLEQAALHHASRVLDVGCGTGTLAILMKQRYPSLEVVGLDPDLKALARATRKAARASVSIRFDNAFSENMPYPEESFDRVVSSFMFHHLGAEDKRAMLREVLRVLKPGGSLHLLDFIGTGTDLQGRIFRLFHSADQMRDNAEAKIIALLTEAGFQSSRKVKSGTVFFRLLRTDYYQANRGTVVS